MVCSLRKGINIEDGFYLCFICYKTGAGSYDIAKTTWRNLRLMKGKEKEEVFNKLKGTRIEFLTKGRIGEGNIYIGICQDCI